MQSFVLGALLLALLSRHSDARCLDCSVTLGSEDTTGTTPTATPHPKLLPLGDRLANLAQALRQTMRWNSNVMLSPLAVGALLAAVRYGATGDTGKQIGKMLGMRSKDDEEFWADLQNALAIMLDNRVMFNTQLTNAIFIADHLTILPEFELQLKQTKTSHVVPVDFGDDPVAAGNYVNEWVSKQTNALDDPFLKKTLPNETDIYMGSILYMSPTWLHQFEFNSTRIAMFKINEREEVPISYMHHRANVLYAADPTAKCQVLGVPYADEDFVAFFVIPDLLGHKGLRDFERRMKGSDMLDVLTSADWQDVCYYIPTTYVVSNNELADPVFFAGALELFNSSSSELDGMVMVPEGAPRPYPSNLKHSVVVSLSEQDNKLVDMARGPPHQDHSDDEECAVTVRVDRPFLLILLHRPTRMPLVWGSMVVPGPHFHPGSKADRRNRKVYL